MGVILDSREVENAEVKRIVLYPNQKRKVEQVLPDLKLLSDKDKHIAMDEYLALPTVYEYYTKMVITYELKDTNNKKLEFKTMEHEINLSSEEDTIDTVKTAIDAELKVKVKADILSLSNVDIDKVNVVEK